MNFFLDFLQQLKRSQLTLLASSLSFTTLLSIAPFIALVVSFAKKLGGLEDLVEKSKPMLWSILASGTDQKMTLQLDSAIENLNSGSLGSYGFIFLLVISTKLLIDFDRAVQKIWNNKKRFVIVKRIPLYLALIAIGPFLLSFLFAWMTTLDLDFIRILPVKLSLFFFMVLFIFLCFHIFAPKNKYWKSAFISAFVTTLLILAGQNLFSWAANNLLFYNKVYGSLASVLLFLIWLWILWIVFLFGINLHCQLAKLFNKKVNV